MGFKRVLLRAVSSGLAGSTVMIVAISNTVAHNDLAERLRAALMFGTLGFCGGYAIYCCFLGLQLSKENRKFRNEYPVLDAAIYYLPLAYVVSAYPALGLIYTLVGCTLIILWANLVRQLGAKLAKIVDRRNER